MTKLHANALGCQKQGQNDTFESVGLIRFSSTTGHVQLPHWALQKQESNVRTFKVGRRPGCNVSAAIIRDREPGTVSFCVPSCDEANLFYVSSSRTKCNLSPSPERLKDSDVPRASHMCLPSGWVLSPQPAGCPPLGLAQVRRPTARSGFIRCH